MWYAIRPLLVYMILFASVQAIGYRLVESLLLVTEQDMAYYYANYEGIVGALILAFAMMSGVLPCLREGKLQIRRMEERQHIWIAHRRDARKLMWVMFAGALCLAFALNIPLTMISGRTSTKVTGIEFALSAVVYGILSPCIEEMIFRGIVYGRLRLDYSFQVSALASAVLFGLYHGNIMQAVYGLIMGWVFALSYELTHRFVVSFALHGCINLLVLTASATGFYRFLCHPAWVLVFALGFAAAARYYVRRLKQTRWDPRK